MRQQRFDALAKDVEAWFKNEGHMAKYRQGLDLLIESKLLTVLQRIGIPNLYNYGSDEHVMASQGNWSNGYQSCLDHLRFFIEIFEPKSEVAPNLGEPDFGGTADALARGDLTKEELQ